MNKLINILLSPLFFALAISLIIIFFLPKVFDKYKVEVVSRFKEPDQAHRIYYHDLDNDGKSEKM
ncbi:MAG: hypothetical protein ABII90_10185 [Bacteroidota bacterium]